MLHIHSYGSVDIYTHTHTNTHIQYQTIKKHKALHQPNTGHITRLCIHCGAVYTQQQIAVETHVCLPVRDYCCRSVMTTAADQSH